MTRATTFRGQPLLVLSALLLSWVGLRASWWESPFDAALPPAAGPLGAIAQVITAQAMAAVPTPAGDTNVVHPPPTPMIATRGRPSTPAALVRMQPAAAASSSSVSGVRPDSVRAALSHSLLLLAGGLSQLELPAVFAAYIGGGGAQPEPGIPAAGSSPALPLSAPARSGSRLSGDAWFMAREETGASAAGRPSYGRSQAGAVLRYRLAPASDHAPQAYLRASSAVGGARDQDLAAGLSGRLLPQVPLRLAAEARIGRTDAGTEVRPAAFVTSELAPLTLPANLRGEAYLQAGYVGGRFATAFADGQARVERPLGRIGEAQLSAGAGIWGGAQKGAARLDAGPTAAVAFPLGEGRGRLAADYRFRLAGEADPASGPALTLSAGF